MKNKLTTINSLKFDEKIHRTWKAKLVEQGNSLLTFVGEFDSEINHPHLGIIGRGTISYEFYWLESWFNVFRFHETDGSLRNFYCNVNMPPTFNDGILDYVDLDIDLLVLKDFSYKILDLEEFQENARIYSYTSYMRKKVQDSLNEMICMIENRIFPFDYNVGCKSLSTSF